MRFRFTATTPELDHSIGDRLNAQARACLAPDMSILLVEVTDAWEFDGTVWSAEAVALASDGRDVFDSISDASDQSRIRRNEAGA